MKSSVSILIGGKAGKGIATIEALLTRAFKRSGYFTFSTREYMSRVRGGSNTTLIRVSSHPVSAVDFSTDIFIPLDKEAFWHARERIHPETFLIAKKGLYECECISYDCDIDALAKEAGNPIVANTIAAALIFGLLGCRGEVLSGILSELYEGPILEVNLRALAVGSELARENGGCRYCLGGVEGSGASNDLFLSGTEGIALGSVAGGCSFVSSYPMSPSTGVLTFLAQHGRTFGICVEQAEDEIAAFQMGLGVWYGGGRALTTTSGGGFALMGEGMSLSGMTETPMVVYLAQRPGPATGLPTRTEQGDLDLAVHAGHGEFPRIILAPGNPGECFELARTAFDLADRYQVPVILLSDQYLADSAFTLEYFTPGREQPLPYIVRTAPEYQRYVLSDNGISPRGIPGYGDGLVLVDSDEHTEEGLITESMEVRRAQHSKRLRKEELIGQSALLPDPSGRGNIAVVGWGSTKHIVQEALERTGSKRAFALHFSWVHPLYEAQLQRLREADAIIVVENNATGQFANRLTLQGLTIRERILKYDGLPFFVDELANRLQTVFEEI